MGCPFFYKGKFLQLPRGLGNHVFTHVTTYSLETLRKVLVGMGVGLKDLQ